MNPKLFYPLVWTKSKLKIDCSLRGRHTRICTLATFQGALIEICTPAGSSEVISLWKQRDVCQLVRNMADGCLTGVWTRGCRKWTDWRVPFIQTSPIHYSSLVKHGQTWSNMVKHGQSVLMHPNDPLYNLRKKKRKAGQTNKSSLCFIFPSKLSVSRKQDFLPR